MAFSTILVAEDAHIYSLLIRLPSFLPFGIGGSVRFFSSSHATSLSTEQVFYWVTFLITQQQKPYKYNTIAKQMIQYIQA